MMEMIYFSVKFTLFSRHEIIWWIEIMRRLEDIEEIKLKLYDVLCDEWLDAYYIHVIDKILWLVSLFSLSSSLSIDCIESIDINTHFSKAILIFS